MTDEAMSPLRRRMIEDMAIRKLAPKTQQGNQKSGRMPKVSNPLRQHNPDDDPEPGTPGTAEDLCPEYAETGKLVDKVTRKRSACEGCDGTGIIKGVG